jgi:hypothetical protein
MIGRADIEGSKSDVAVDAWPPRASYPCGNFSDTSWIVSRITKGSLSRRFRARAIAEGPGQRSISLYRLRGVSVPTELRLGHLRYVLTDVPPQPNSPSALVLYPAVGLGEPEAAAHDGRIHALPAVRRPSRRRTVRSRRVGRA